MIVGLTFALLLVLLFINAPVFVAILGSSIFYFVANNSLSWMMVVQRTISGLESIPLLAVPFFVMAGVFMNYTGITSRMIRFAEVLTGHMPGGLAQTNVVLSTLMGGLSGSSLADAAMQSKILVPEMEKRGYGAAFSTAITAASSAIAPVIPPGINLIIYALIAQVSVAKMFIGGYVPGILMCVALMVAVNIISRRRGYAPVRDRMSSPKDIFLQLKESIWALLLPFGIIMGIRFGVFTPTEAGAIAVLFCTVVGVFFYKQLKWKHIPIILKNTVYSTSAVILIIIAANVFGLYLSWERIPHSLTQILMTFSASPWMMLALINVFLLLMGMFLEGGAVLIIVAPLLVPVMRMMGMDMIHFGLILIVNIMIGGITPPFGSMMFTTCSITKVPVGDFIREVWPFIIALLVVLLVVTYIPSIVLILPNLL